MQLKWARRRCWGCELADHPPRSFHAALDAGGVVTRAYKEFRCGPEFLLCRLCVTLGVTGFEQEWRVFSDTDKLKRFLFV
jgi:hypothetical protein